ncbi:MAG: YIP1 family protein [Deltaproteobacteria bacterium]|nr:YIP1 family protein [Deltaproteobacteria bacterium]
MKRGIQSQSGGQFEPASTLDYFKKAVEIVKVNQTAMAQVARDPNAIRFGIAVTAIGGALAFIPGNTLAGVLVGAFFSILVLFLFAGIVHLFCGYSKGKQEFMGFVRIIGLSGIIDWAVIIPFAGLAITIWSVVISIVATQEVYHLTRGKATFIVLISALILWTISLMIFVGPLSFLYEIPGQ